MSMLKTAALDKRQAIDLLNGFFKQFQDCCNRPHSPEPSNFNQYLSENFQISSNGQVIGKNLSDYLSRVENFQKRYSHVDLPRLLEEPLICDHQVVAYYVTHVTSHEGKKTHLYFMAIATVENQKFTNWVQVDHEKNAY